MPRSNNAHDFNGHSILFKFANRMRHHQKQNFVYPSERLPPLLAVDDPLRDRDIQRVIKYPAGGFKADAMLPLIREVLGFILLKANAIHAIIVHTLRHLRFGELRPATATKPQSNVGPRAALSR